MAAPQELYYKLTGLDGTDFWTGSYDYAKALETGEVIRHSTSTVINPADDSTYFSIAVTPGDTFGNGFVFGRLFQVEPVGEIERLDWHERRFRNWCGVLALRVVKEIPLAEAFGPNGARLLEFFALIRHVPKEFFWALAKNYEPPTPAGIGLQIRDATKDTGVFAAAIASHIHIGGAAMYHAPKTMADDIKTDAAQALSDTGWGILTRGLIPPEYTDVCMRTWRKTFNGDDYA